MGEYIVPALLEGGFKVTVISRPGRHGYTAGAKVVSTVEAAYDDISGLTAVLRDHDALIEIFNPAATVHQRTIVQAALEAGIKHLITNEFGFDTFNPNTKDLVSAGFKLDAQRTLEDELQTSIANGKPPTLSWTGIFTGVWYDWAIREGKFWVNPATRTITRFGSGDQKTSISRVALNGEAVVAVLREPERFRNRPAYFASHTVTTNEMISLIQEISGDSEKPLNVADVPDVNAFMREAIRLWDEDTGKGVENRSHSHAYAVLSAAALFDENNKFGADLSEKLEPGRDEGTEILKDQLRQLFKEAGN